MRTTSVMITEISVEANRNLGEKAKNIHRPATIAAMKLRQKLKELADLRGWSIRQVAERAKIAQQTLDSAMAGHDLRVSAAIRVAKVMGVSVEWLFDDSKGLDDIDRHPFWLEPGTALSEKIAAFKGLNADLDRIVAEKHGVEPAMRPKQLPRQSGTGHKRKGA